MAYRRVAAIAELWKGEMMGAVVDGRKVLLVRTDDEILAYEDRCAHLGVALSEGRLDGTVLTCSAHHWQYDITTGRGVNPAHTCLTRFATVLEQGTIFVDIDKTVSPPQLGTPKGAS